MFNCICASCYDSLLFFVLAIYSLIDYYLLLLGLIYVGISLNSTCPIVKVFDHNMQVKTTSWLLYIHL